MDKTTILGGAMRQVQKQTRESIWELGAAVLREALQDAELETVDAVYSSNMLGDELQQVKHLAALIASEAGLRFPEAMEIRAAMAGGAAALRAACLLIESGQATSVAVVGVEQMSREGVQAALAKALHPRLETARGGTMLTAAAEIMEQYLKLNGPDIEAFSNFAVNARANAARNPQALFQQAVDACTVNESRVVAAPLRLYDCAPICDGAAAIVLGAASHKAQRRERREVRIVGSAAAADHMAVAERPDLLSLSAAHISAARAYAMARLGPQDIDFFELHDAFSIMAVMALEACGFAERGQGWRLAADGAIFADGGLPLQTMGGLLGRGHPIGATAIYQTLEAYLQISGRAGANQLGRADVGMLQSIGGAGVSLFTHILRGA